MLMAGRTIDDQVEVDPAQQRLITCVGLAAGNCGSIGPALSERIDDCRDLEAFLVFHQAFGMDPPAAPTLTQDGDSDWFHGDTSNDGLNSIFVNLSYQRAYG
jgi:hypothetical protein